MTIETATPLSRPRSSRPVSESKGDAEASSTVNEAVTWIVLGVCLVAWAIIGFLLWIPRVLRAMFLFSVALVQATTTDSSAEDAGTRLRRAAEFYTRGFTRAVQGIRSTTRRDQQESKSGDGWHIDIGLILREAGWAAVIWYTILLSFGFAVLTPVDLISQLGEVPWAGIWSSTIQTIESIPVLLFGARGAG